MYDGISALDGKSFPLRSPPLFPLIRYTNTLFTGASMTDFFKKKHTHRQHPPSHCRRLCRQAAGGFSTVYSCPGPSGRKVLASSIWSILSTASASPCASAPSRPPYPVSLPLMFRKKNRSSEQVL